jgi:hypothetical protein
MVALHLGKVASAYLLLGYKMEEKTRRIQDLINLSYVLGFLTREGGGRVDVKEEDDSNNGAMTNTKLKSGAKGNDGHCGQLVATIVELRDLPPLDRVYWKPKERLMSTKQHVLPPWSAFPTSASW